MASVSWCQENEIAFIQGMGRHGVLATMTPDRVKAQLKGYIKSWDNRVNRERLNPSDCIAEAHKQLRLLGVTD